MSRLISILAVVAACGGSPRPPTSPLPGDARPAATPAAPAPSAKAEAGSDKDKDDKDKDDEDAKAEAAPPRPTGPVELKIPAGQTTVKVVSDGKGKKQALRYTTKAGVKQAVEVALDFTGKQEGKPDPGGKPDNDESVVPTIVLTGEAETRTVDKDGGAEYTLTVTATDARAASNSSVSVDAFKTVLGSLAGLTIGGKRGANGASGDLTLRIEHPPTHGADALELIRIMFPALPVLPTQAVGVGARWQATTTAKLADKLDVTQVTDYELVDHKGASWTIKGTTKVSGKDQEVESAKISAISGSGSSETTIVDGALYPTHKASVETQFTASDGDKSSHFTIKLGGAVTPK